jgi:hypothetical protein
LEIFGEVANLLVGTDDIKKIALFSEATFIFKIEFIARLARSATDVPFIPLQLS